MPGRRFRKDILETQFFGAGGAWTDPVTALPYIKAGMAARIQAAMGVAAVPTVRETLRFIVIQTRQAAATPQFTRYTALQAVLGMMVWNPRHMTCDPGTKYLRRVPNRFAFNILAELVGYAQANPAGVGVGNATAYLNGMDRATIQRNVICRFNEGVIHGQPLDPAVNGQPTDYLCRQTPSNTAGGTAFAGALSSCPCHATAGECGGDNRCTWNAQHGKCHASAGAVHGAGRTRGSKYRSIANGRVYTPFTKGPAAETQMPPPDLAAQWNAPNGVRFTQGARKFYAP